MSVKLSLLYLFYIVMLLKLQKVQNKNFVIKKQTTAFQNFIFGQWNSLNFKGIFSLQYD